MDNRTTELDSRSNESERPRFLASTPVLAFLREFTSIASAEPLQGFGRTTSDLDRKFPWICDPSWGKDNISRHGLEELKTEIHRVDAMVLTMDDFLQCIRVRQARLREYREDIARKVQFSRLSDDVLTIIFELASSPDEVGRGEDEHICYMTPHRLSQVSRKFQRIVKSISHLWIPPVIDSRQGVKGAKLALALDDKTDSSISVHMRNAAETKRDDSSSRSQFFKFFEFVTGLNSRLSSLHFHLNFKTDGHLVGGFEVDLVGLDLRSLRTLELDFENAPSYGMTWVERVCGSWDMPSLETLLLHNALPGLRPNILQKLNYYSLTLGSRKIAVHKDAGWQKKGFGSIVAILNELSAVRVLQLELFGNKKDVVGAETNRALHINLPMVQHLSVTAFGLGRDSGPFWRAFNAPNVTSWTIEFDVPSQPSTAPTPNDPPLKARLANIFLGPSRAKYPELKELNFVIRHAVDESDFAVLASFLKSNTQRFSMFSNVEDVSIAFPGSKLQASSDGGGTISFRPVRLKNCKGTFGEVFRQLESKFIEPGGAGLPPIVVDGGVIREMGWLKWNEEFAVEN